MTDLTNDIIDNILMRISRLTPAARREIWRELRDYCRQQIVASANEAQAKLYGGTSGLPEFMIGTDGPNDPGDR